MSTSLEQILTNLQPDEREIAETALARLDQGRSVYGPWQVDDGRDYPTEAIAEVIDALHYCAAELVRLRRARPQKNGRRQKVYICHPFGGDPEGNARRTRIICRAFIKGGNLPIAPSLYLPALVDEHSDRELAIALCLELIAICDELWVFGVVTDGMRQEIDRAEALGIPVRVMSKEVQP